MISQTLKKLQNNRGESLVEALCAMIIVVMIMAVLSTAIVTSAEMNQKAKLNDKAYAEQHNTAEIGDWKTEGTPKKIVFTDASGASIGSYDVERTDTTGNGLSAFRLKP